MSRMIWALVGLIVAAFVFAVASFYLAERVTTGQTFFSNLFLNVVAELFGLGLVVAGTLILAVRYARKKLENWLHPLQSLWRS